MPVEPLIEGAVEIAAVVGSESKSPKGCLWIALILAVVIVALVLVDYSITSKACIGKGEPETIGTVTMCRQFDGSYVKP